MANGIRTAGQSCDGPVWRFLLFWLPGYFKAMRSLDINKSWYCIVFNYAIVTVLSIVGGWITGYLTGRITRARKTGTFIFTLCALPVLYEFEIPGRG